jgi:hypothetical protein
MHNALPLPNIGYFVFPMRNCIFFFPQQERRVDAGIHFYQFGLSLGTILDAGTGIKQPI